MTAEKILINDIVQGTSDQSYQEAMAEAMKSAHIHTDSSCVVNVVLFGMCFEHGKFCVSVQIIVTTLDFDKDKLDHDREDGAQITGQKNHPHHDDYDLNALLDEISETMNHNETVLLLFNNESLTPHLDASLKNVWEINPQSLSYQDIEKAVMPYVHVPEPRLHLYTQPVQDVGALIPENTGFTRHFVDFVVDERTALFQRELDKHMKLALDEYIASLPKPQPKMTDKAA